jgi:hypothetical protein
MYKVLTSNSIHSLEEKVDKYRKDGYRLQGGVAIAASHSGMMSYGQAVIKDDESEAKVIALNPTMFGQRHRDNVPQQTMN